MIRQQGFTLIEALAAGLISTIVAGALLTVLYMSTAQIKEGSAYISLLSMQSIVSEQIRSSVRSAKIIKRVGELGTSTPTLVASAFTGLKEIWLLSKDGDTLAAYQVRPGEPYLYEWKAGAYQVFKVGNLTVDIDYGQTEFGILANRLGMTFQIGHIKTVGASSYAFPASQDTILMRNR